MTRRWRIAVTPLLASPYATMSVAGTFNGWNPAANNMQLVTNDTWQFDATFNGLTNFQFKFAANGNWTTNWGDNSQELFTAPFAGTGQSYGANIVLNTQAKGLYRFTFNDQTLVYSAHYLGPVIATNPPVLGGCAARADGSFQFAFTNRPGASFTVLGTTNLSLPLSNWTALGAPIESAAGQFQFTDAQATDGRQRFYRLRSP